MVLAYVIHGFRTNSTGPFSCLGDDSAAEGAALPNGNSPVSLQQLALQHQLRLAQQQEQDALRQKYDSERRMTTMFRSPTSSALLNNPLPLKTPHR